MSVWLEGGPAESFAPSLSMGELWAAPAGAELCSQALHSLEEQPVPWPAAAAAVAGVLLLVFQQKGADEIWSPAQAAANTGRKDGVQKGCICNCSHVFQHWRVEFEQGFLGH